MPDIILPGQSGGQPATIITEKMVNAHPELEKIAPKEATAEEKLIAKIHEVDTHKAGNAIRVPDIYFWVDYNILEVPTQMTCAFKWQGSLFGETWKIEENWSKSRRRAYERKLMKKMIDSLGLLIHMGKLILDATGNIDPVKATDEVARRYFLDKLWKARIDAFHKIVRVKAINVVKAKELGLI